MSQQSATNETARGVVVPPPPPPPPPVVNVSATLRLWLETHPLGPCRYRSGLRPAVLDMMKQHRKWDSLDLSRYALDTHRQFFGGDYCFFRLSLNKLALDFDAFRDPHPVLNYGEENCFHIDGGLHHGDIVILHPYRGTSTYLCYGPANDLLLIKTGGEYGYCIPQEFCDAPEGYFECVNALSERAWPSPSLLPPLELLAKEDAEELEAFAKLSGKPCDDATVFGCKMYCYDDCLPHFSSLGDDGFLIVRQGRGVAEWIDVCLEVLQFSEECRIAATAAAVTAKDCESPSLLCASRKRARIEA